MCNTNKSNFKNIRVYNERNEFLGFVEVGTWWSERDIARKLYSIYNLNWYKWK
jgi:hypothetical protein